MFHFHTGFSFVNVEEPRTDSREPEHLTSSATCYTSLLECPKKPEKTPLTPALRSEYADAAINLPQSEWVSDGSAGTYCRCRALPFVIRHLTAWHENVSAHVEAIFEQMSMKSNRFSIGEAGSPLDQKDWYPPNGYHPYWALELLGALEDTFPYQFGQLEERLKLDKLKEKMHFWSKEALVTQVSLHSANSSKLDSDQLAWCLAIALRFPEHTQPSLSEQDILRQAFKCLFQTQTPVGNWRHYEPLFHYEKSGNAYCYVFESFAEILRWALKPRAQFARSSLKAHCQGLLHSGSTLSPPKYHSLPP